MLGRTPSAEIDPRPGWRAHPGTTGQLPDPAAPDPFLVPPSPPCALTIDVEDYFQVWALAPYIERTAWEDWPRRVEHNTDRLLALLAAKGRRATFFTLGWIAERHPRLIQRIVAAGHELASHGYDHRLVATQSPAEFRSDVAHAKALLEDIAGCHVRGYRAPSFSLGSQTPWAHAILAEEGHLYSSSSHPVLNDHYGDLSGVVVRALDGVLEVPVTTAPVLGCRLPCGGGGYFRLLPYAWTRWGLERTRRQEPGPIVFYLHPWELDPDQPRPPGVSLRTRLRHYTNLRRCAARLDRLLGAFPWQRLDEALELDPA